MDVAYDKLEVCSGPAFGADPPAWARSPISRCLDLMTTKAIEVLSNSFAQPPVHPDGGRARRLTSSPHPQPGGPARSGTRSRFDKGQVGVGRAPWASKRPTKDTLIVVTADHDQSMSIIGVSNTPGYRVFQPRAKSEKISVKTTAGDQGFSRVWGDFLLPTASRPASPFRETRAPPRATTGGLPAMPGHVRSLQPGGYALDRHLFDLLRLAGLQAGRRYGLPGECGPADIRRIARRVPYRRSHGKQRAGDRRGSGRVPLHGLHGPDRYLLSRWPAAVSTDTFRRGQAAGRGH